MLTLFFAIMLTACSSAPPESKLDLEELADNLYIDYDKAKLKNITAHRPYYAEIAVYGEDEMLPFFSTSPSISKDENYLRFEGSGESGYTHTLGGMHFGRENWIDLANVYHSCNANTEELSFMPISELYERFENDAHRFVQDMELYEMCSITAEDFAKVAAEEEPPDLDKGWSEPKDFYYVFARQFLDGIPIFTSDKLSGIERYLQGPKIIAIYSEDGVEYFHIIGSTFNVTGEAPVNGTFIDYAGAEQIVREIYGMPYGYDQIILDNADLVYVAVYDENDRIVLTPMWEFYRGSDGPTASKDCDLEWIRVDAYTGELFISNS